VVGYLITASFQISHRVYQRKNFFLNRSIFGKDIDKGSWHVFCGLHGVRCSAIYAPPGPRNHVNCAEVLTLSGQSVPWVSVMRYLGIFIVRSLKFKCSFEAAKRSVYRTANSIFGKIGRSASEETTLQLIQTNVSLRYCMG